MTHPRDYLLPPLLYSKYGAWGFHIDARTDLSGKLIVAMDGQNYSSLYEVLFMPLFSEGKKSRRLWILYPLLSNTNKILFFKKRSVKLF